jgi:hypothetical protein
MKNITAAEAKTGQVVRSLRYRDENGEWMVERVPRLRWSLRRPLRHYPHITDVHFLEYGEDGRPTYYITLSDEEDFVYPLAPDEELMTVA